MVWPLVPAEPRCLRKVTVVRVARGMNHSQRLVAQWLVAQWLVAQWLVAQWLVEAALLPPHPRPLPGASCRW